MKALPFLCCLARPSALLRATVVDLLIFAGHVLLYPTGIHQERRAAGLLLEPDDTVRHPSNQHGAPSERSTDPEPDPGRRPARAPDPSAARARTPSSTRPLPPPKDDAHAPVLLLHGFIDNRSIFVLLRRSLVRHGWRHVEALNYSPLTCDIRKAAELLGRHVEGFCERTGHQRVDVVGHSLGGLIARYYVQRLGGDRRVRTLVTLGTPHAGTRVAPVMSAHPIVRQMRPDSEVIAELARPAPNCRTHFVCFWSDLDQLMVPVGTARIDHPDLIAHSVRVSGVGHLALPVNGAVAAGIREALTAAEAAQGTDHAISVA
ncbi:alpha/beta fold hydrolase [Streptomyces sp. NPDC003077]|uniref:esterase/lipase family protein n=1 Tax=Streptomyces sp. NPDC003077 TaxID=3154443 RepID=UPI0033B8CA38